MNGINTFYDSLNNPFKGIIDFEYLVSHPEAKFNIWEKYNNDPAFKLRIDEMIERDVVFKNRFNNAFNSFINNKTK